MKVLALRTELSGKKLEEALVSFDAILVERTLVRSIEEIHLAEHLAKRAFEKKKNIAKKMKYEFLLWLTGKTDLASAFRIAKPKGDEMMLIVFSGDEKDILKALDAKLETMWAKPTSLPGARHLRAGNPQLETQADPLELERISLSRVKN